MSAQPTRTQKPLLLPGIAPHLFQSCAPAHLQAKMLIKDSPEGPVVDHSQTPSGGSTVAAPTLEEIQAALRTLQIEHQDLRWRMERIESTRIPPAFQAMIANTLIWCRDSVHCFLWFLLLRWKFDLVMCLLQPLLGLAITFLPSTFTECLPWLTSSLARAGSVHFPRQKKLPPFLPQFNKSTPPIEPTHIFDQILPASKEVPVIIWALETSTDPELVETAANANPQPAMACRHFGSLRFQLVKMNLAQEGVCKQEVIARQTSEVSYDKYSSFYGLFYLEARLSREAPNFVSMLFGSLDVRGFLTGIIVIMTPGIPSANTVT
ncbi:hypothetical protein B0H14DRAFT_2654517 [Mycena olivaceomarginata]|nr:hypothetical protein B0H14DRAFT_2654517 [Mycena olivaceomarginata]